MSYKETRASLLTAISNCITQYNTDNGANVGIAYENKTFNPSPYEQFVKVFLIPATSEAMGKGSSDSDDRRGIFQVSVYVKSNSKDYDIIQLDIIDYVVSWFKFGESFGEVQVTEQTVNNGRTSESWFARDISINYLSFVDR